NGLSGTKMESIAKAARVNKALVYRHFERKELLFQRVLVNAYRRMREAEAVLTISADPMVALDQLCEFTLTYYRKNPGFLVLVGIANLHHGDNLRSVPRSELAIDKLMTLVGGIIARGEATGVFRKNLNPADLWISLSSQCWFSVATAYTVEVSFGKSILEDQEADRRLATIKEVIRRYVLA
ncbi:MAG: TetR/AcrR family transcriptional regulator, partial [Mesorhizobium sp.]